MSAKLRDLPIVPHWQPRHHSLTRRLREGELRKYHQKPSQGSRHNQGQPARLASRVCDRRICLLGLEQSAPVDQLPPRSTRRPREEALRRGARCAQLEDRDSPQIFFNLICVLQFFGGRRLRVSPDQSNAQNLRPSPELSVLNPSLRVRGLRLWGCQLRHQELHHGARIFPAAFESVVGLLKSPQAS